MIDEASEWGTIGGRLRWKNKTKAQKSAHGKMMSLKAAAKRKKRRKKTQKPLDT